MARAYSLLIEVSIARQRGSTASATLMTFASM